MFHNFTANAVQSSTARKSVNVALTDADLAQFKVTPDFDFFPFMSLVQNMVGGLWALSLYLVVGAWILAAIGWVCGRVFRNGTAQQYSGTVFVWCAIATMLVGSAMAVVKFFAVQALF